MNLVLIERSELQAFGIVELSGVRAAHLVKVLNVSPGSSVRCGVIDGPRGVGIVRIVADARVTLDVTFEDEQPPRRPQVDLLLALPRPKVMRRLWAQIAAIGVGQIILTNAERVERNYFDTHVLEPDHYRPLLLEGLQQARDTRLPQVSIHRQFRPLVEDQLGTLFPGGIRLLAQPEVKRRVKEGLAEGDRQVLESRDRVLIAIGPEGGWNGFETQLLCAHGFVAIGMGSRTLRTDTACIALLALVHEALQDET